MQDEIQALHLKGAWILVPFLSYMNVVGNH